MVIYRKKVYMCVYMYFYFIKIRILLKYKKKFNMLKIYFLFFNKFY